MQQQSYGALAAADDTLDQHGWYGGSISPSKLDLERGSVGASAFFGPLFSEQFPTQLVLSRQAWAAAIAGRASEARFGGLESASATLLWRCTGPSTQPILTLHLRHRHRHRHRHRRPTLFSVKAKLAANDMRV
ncbi:hypothetical protein L1887_42104 [Cichorium endivia]|nr:hypothetical protein L1887_42104 [Cichorium endivia]